MAAQTSDCSYSHRGIGSQSVGGECPAWRSGWEVSGSELCWRNAYVSGRRICRSRRARWTDGRAQAGKAAGLCLSDGCLRHRKKRERQMLRKPAVQRREVALACEVMGPARYSLSHLIRRPRIARPARRFAISVESPSGRCSTASSTRSDQAHRRLRPPLLKGTFVPTISPVCPRWLAHENTHAR